jgi:hypothetical protein
VSGKRDGAFAEPPGLELVVPLTGPAPLSIGCVRYAPPSDDGAGGGTEGAELPALIDPELPELDPGLLEPIEYAFAGACCG